MPTMLSDKKRRDIQDAIRAGMTVKNICVLLSTTSETISKIKREMGIPLRRMKKPLTPQAKLRKREEQEAGYLKAVQAAQAHQATIMHHRDISRHSYMESYLERVKELEKLRERDFATSPEDITSEDEQPAPSPAQAYTPQEYFEAIATGLRERDDENAALKDEVTSLRSVAARLEADNLKLVSDLNQCKLQMANWSGPAALPNRVSLGNGG